MEERDLVADGRHSFSFGPLPDSSTLAVAQAELKWLARIGRSRMSWTEQLGDLEWLHHQRREVRDNYELHFVLRRDLWYRFGKEEVVQEFPPVYVFFPRDPDAAHERAASLAIRGHSSSTPKAIAPFGHLDLDRALGGASSTACGCCGSSHMRRVKELLPAVSLLRGFIAGERFLRLPDDDDRVWFDPRLHCEWALHLPALWELSVSGDEVSVSWRGGSYTWRSPVARELTLCIAGRASTYSHVLRADPSLAMSVASGFLATAGEPS